MKTSISTADLALFFRDHPTPMWIIGGGNLNIREVNRAAVKLFKARRMDMIDSSLAHWFQEELKSLRKILSASNDVYQELGVFSCEAVDEKPLLILLKGKLIHLDDELCHMLVADDILASVEAEQSSKDFHNAIVNSSIVSRANLKGDITYVNDNFIKISGYSKRELLGRNHRIINSGYHPKSFWVEMWKTIASGKMWRADVKNKAKDGSYYWVDTFVMPFLDEHGKVKEYLSIRNDITSKKAQAEEIIKLNQSLSDFQKAITNASIVSRADKQGNIIFANDNFLRISGYSFDELIGQNHRILNSGHHPKSFWVEMWKTIAAGKMWRADVKNKAKDGSYYWVDTFVMPLLDENGKPREYLSIRNDITQRKHAKEELRMANINLSETLVFGRMGSAQLNLKDNMLEISKELLMLLDVESNEPHLMPLDLFVTTYVKPAYIEPIYQIVQKQKRGELKHVVDLEFEMRTAKGREIWISAKGIFKGNSALAILHDITDAKRSVEIIQRSELTYRLLYDNIPSMYFILDRNLQIRLVNNLGSILLHYEKQELIGQSVLKIFPAALHGVVEKQIAECFDHPNQVFKWEIQKVRKDGTVIIVEETAWVGASSDGEVLINIICNDITDRKRAEQELSKSARLTALTSRINELVLHVQDPQKVYVEACRIAVEYGGFRMAWIGVPQGDFIIPVTHWGHEDGYLSNIPAISILDTPNGRGATGKAVREKRTVVNNDFLHNQEMILWREEALLRQYNSSIALPIVSNNTVLSVLTLYHSEVNFFAGSEIEMLERMVENIGFALATLSNSEKRRLAETSLVESEERFRGLIQDLNVGVLLQGPHSEILICNQASCRLLGMTEDQLRGKTSVDDDWRVEQEDGGAFPTDQLPVLCAIRTKQTVRGVVMRVHRASSNDWIWLLADAIPRFDADGNVVNVVCTIYDISEIKVAQSMMTESEERFRRLTEELGVGVLLQGVNDEILFANAAAEEMMGLTADQLMGKSSFNPDWRVVHEDGSDFAPEARPSVLAVKSKQKVENVTMGVYRPGKKDWVWLLTSAVPLLNNAGDIRQVIVSMADITEQKALSKLVYQNEARQRQILNTMHNGVLVVSAEGKLVYANKNALDMFSLSFEAATKIDYLSKLLPWKVSDRYGNEIPYEDAPIIKTIQTQHSYVNVELGIRTAGGKTLWVMESTMPMYDHNGKFNEVLISILDITEYIESQKIVEEQRKLIDAVSEIQAQYIEERSPHEYFDLALKNVLELTESEYGFVGEVIYVQDNPQLKTYAVTNIAWNEETHRLHKEMLAGQLLFTNLSTLFGAVMTEKRVIISNEPHRDKRSGGLPKGHPSLNSFMGLPIMRGTELVGMVGVANKANGYNDQMARTLAPILNTIGSIIQALRTERITQVISENLKETTRQLHLAYRASGLGVMQLDFIKKIITCDERAQEILGMNRAVAPFTEYEEMLHPDEKDNWIIESSTQENSPTTEFSSEYRIIRKTGAQVRYLKSQGLFFRDASGQPVSAVSVIQDQTREKHYEDGLLNSLREKEMLIKEIHHRVKNNLQLISSMLYLKMLDWNNPESREFMTSIREKIKSVSLIHERLLQTESLNSINIQEYLPKLLHDLEVTYHRSDLELRIVSDVEPIYFTTDQATYLGQIVNEMVNNAMKHAFVSRAQGEIHVSLHQTPSGYELLIRDNGVGLPKETDPARAKSYGMQLVQIFVKQLKGTLEVLRDQGTGFRIIFR